MRHSSSCHVVPSSTLRVTYIQVTRQPAHDATADQLLIARTNLRKLSYQPYETKDSDAQYMQNQLLKA